jgi:hypothetical protein
MQLLSTCGWPQDLALGVGETCDAALLVKEIIAALKHHFQARVNPWPVSQGAQCKPPAQNLTKFKCCH